MESDSFPKRLIYQIANNNSIVNDAIMKATYNGHVRWKLALGSAVIELDKQIKTLEQSSRMRTPFIVTQDHLKPGLELDKLIAKDVLGWYHFSDVGGARAWWFLKTDDQNPLQLPRFSKDIKSAWELVETCRLCVIPFKDGWTAFEEGCFHQDAKHNAASTTPHAICLAALRTVGRNDD